MLRRVRRKGERQGPKGYEGGIWKSGSEAGLAGLRELVHGAAAGSKFLSHGGTFLSSNFCFVDVSLRGVLVGFLRQADCPETQTLTGWVAMPVMIFMTLLDS